MLKLCSTYQQTLQHMTVRIKTTTNATNPINDITNKNQTKRYKKKKPTALNELKWKQTFVL